MGTHVSGLVANVLFGQTRRDVLALLFGRPGERFYLREILRALGGGTGAVQRELKQLVDAGLVVRQAEGHQVYFSANRESAIFPELQAIVQKTAGVTDVLRVSLAPLLRGERVSVAFVYGSVARGEQTAQSDVDLFVLGDVTLADLVPLIRVAERKLGREVNPSTYPVREFAAKLKRGAPFLKRVMAEPKLFVEGSERALGRLAE